MSLITCDKISVKYENIKAISNVSFKIFNDDYLCIVGENGSGKSTLVKSLLGLVHPCEGKIIFSDELKKSHIGYLPQQSVTQKDFPASVYEVVISGCMNRKGLLPFYNKQDKEIAMSNIKKLNIESIKHKCYAELSGGQQQRVLLARALCSTNKLVILDEPVSGLDPLITEELYELVKDLNDNQHIAIIMVSHDIKSAVKYAKHILHMSNECLFYGTTSDYLKSEPYKSFSGGDLNV